MDRDNKFIVAIVVAVIAALALVITTSLIAKNISKVKLETSGFAVGAAAGETFDTAKVAQIGINSATTTIGSIYNGSGRKRVITRAYLMQDKSSTAQSSTAANTLYIAASSSLSVGYASGTTVTSSATVASTTFAVVFDSFNLSVADPIALLWPTGTYLNFVLSTLTTTTVGIAGVEYFNY